MVALHEGLADACKRLIYVESIAALKRLCVKFPKN